jgi:hypothetical protein
VKTLVAGPSPISPMKAEITHLPYFQHQISVTIPINRLKRCRFAVDIAISSLSKRLKERNKAHFAILLYIASSLLV